MAAASAKPQGEMTVDYYAGIDVSLECSSVCVVDGLGKIVREAKVPREPESLIAWFAALEVPLARIGLEAGPLSQWLFAGLQASGWQWSFSRCAACATPSRRCL
ncbi:hypothetical protein [Mesorhizobium sp. M1E.F.Ca.ET.041.01.1.1]|uniref:hypothetical protein n=1 Tax=Mesorhizobium sp. M1E.F.Ca.ET.041.01.1.1 TaxID=2496759 RepID=UPI000FC9CA13|nr:hypothetical protein [Mesorhizobium sp. M1E.F.Ca.ET.041.01.1.1]RUW18811.1 hypothetical protein EOA38_35345 [Mesorhizobium sp. M1E.F.Ca.ET.041.01.1.1]RWD81401.1 MAG: hypothetical protein EOS38_28685 [Mesorhizobium sp.]